MQTFLLSDEEFHATFAAPMNDVTQEAIDVIDIWPYVSSIPASDLTGHQLYDQLVEFVYRDARNRFDHVLVMTKTKNTYLAIVVDLAEDCVHGQYLLNLNEKYGFATPPNA